MMLNLTTCKVRTEHKSVMLSPKEPGWSQQDILPLVEKLGLNLFSTLAFPQSAISPSAPLIPILHRPIQPRRNDLTALPRLPRHRRHRPLIRLHLMIHLAALPIPEAHESRTVTTADVLSAWRYRHVDCVARGVVSTEGFLYVELVCVVRGGWSSGSYLFILLKLVGRENNNLIIRRLKRRVFPRRMRRSPDKRKSLLVRKVLDRHRDRVFYLTLASKHSAPQPRPPPPAIW